MKKTCFFMIDDVSLQLKIMLQQRVLGGEKN